MKKRKLLNKNTIFLISFVVIIADQSTKQVLSRFLQQGHTFTLIPRFIQLNIVKNTGAAFSLLNGSTLLLSLLSLLVSIVLIIWILNNSPFKFWNGLGLGFLLAGAIGNGIDRFTMGYVIDFLELIPVEFPIFNIADISINIALICILIESLKAPKSNN